MARRRSKNKCGGAKRKATEVERYSSYGSLPTTNSIYQAYYHAIGIFKDEEDEKNFMSALTTELPVTIRLHTEGKFADFLRDELRTKFSTGYPITLSDELLERLKKSGRYNTPSVINDPPLPIPWYPENNGWRCGTSKFVIRKSPDLKDLHNFLVAENSAGFISRQEEASMIPPFFLDVQPHHYVLDMCAAPGSKTAQLLEALHKKDCSNNFKAPEGLLIANDANRDRAYMLTNMMKRIPSPNLIITHHDGKNFPAIQNYLHTGDDKPHGFFDRILADVPCSGDGTIRKSPEIWKDWDPHNSVELHKVQLLIAQRCVNLLKVGGLMVYSTCSLNPVENEAVVAALLRANEGAIELVDTSATLPALKRRPGISSWIVARKTKTESIVETAPEVLDGSKGSVIQIFKNQEEYLAGTKDMSEKKLAPHTVWPPSKEECKVLNLERCMRIMPQDQNTSGFFVCLLRKVKKNPNAVNVNKVTEPLHEVLSREAENNGRKAGAKDTERASRPIESNMERNDEYIPISDDTWQTIRNDYGFKDDSQKKLYFARIGDGQIMKKGGKRQKVEPKYEQAGDIAKNVTYVSDSVSKVLTNNIDQKLHIVNAGTCVMKRDYRKLNGEVSVGYRVYQDSTKFLLPQITERIIELTLEDIRNLFAVCIYKTDDENLKKRMHKSLGTPLQMLSDGVQQLKGVFKGAVIGKLVEADAKVYQDLFGQPLSLTLYFGIHCLQPLITAELAENIITHLRRVDIIKKDTLTDIDVAESLNKFLPQL